MKARTLLMVAVLGFSCVSMAQKDAKNAVIKTPTAKKVMDGAIAKAGSQKKAVFLSFDASW